MDFSQDSGYVSAQAALGFWHEGFKIPRANRIVMDLLFEEDFSMENGRCPWRSAPAAFIFVNFFPDQSGPEGDDSDPAQPCGQRSPRHPHGQPGRQPQVQHQVDPHGQGQEKQGGRVLPTARSTTEDRWQAKAAPPAKRPTITASTVL